MKTNFRKKWILSLGILIITLGLIHVLSTFYFYKSINKSILPSIFMFVATGLSVIFSGALTVYCAKIIGVSEKIGTTVLKFILCFFYTLSVGAILSLANNPFPFMMLGLAILLNISLLNKQNV